MYITIYKHVPTMSERIQTIYKHFAVVLLNLFRQQYFGMHRSDRMTKPSSDTARILIYVDLKSDI